MSEFKELTPEQIARIPEWDEKWMPHALSTAEPDYPRAIKGLRELYRIANQPFPPDHTIVTVQSPMRGALVSVYCTGLAHLTKDMGGKLDDKDIDGQMLRAVEDRIARKHPADARFVARRLAQIWQTEITEDTPPPTDQQRKLVDNLVYEYPHLLGGQYWVGGWWGSPAFRSFLKEVVGIEIPADEEEKGRAFEDVCMSVSLVWPNIGYIVLCDRPAEIHFVNDRLHNDSGKPALAFKDGAEMYFIEDTYFEKEMYHKVISGKMKFSEIMAIDNADIRAIALKYNPQAIIDEGAELVSQSTDFRQWKNELFRIKGREANRLLEEPDVFFLRMQCPTGRVFIEGVEPNLGKALTEKGNGWLLDYLRGLNLEAADAAQARAMNLTPEQYARLRNEG